MDTSQKLLSSPRELAVIDCDEQEETARREQALAELIRAYEDAVAHPARAAEAGCVLAECLAPAIRKMARRVAQGGSQGDKADFVDEATSLVLAPRAGLPPPICN